MTKVGSEGDGAPPSLVSRWRSALPPQVQAWRNSETAASTLSRFDILAEARHSETRAPKRWCKSTTS